MPLPIDDHTVTERGPGLWTASTSFSILGADFGRRTVCLSRNGITALLSPSRSCRAEIQAALGQGARADLLIAPTAFHDTWFAEAADAFPDAHCLTSPALTESALHTTPLPGGLPAEWKDRIVAFPLDGMPRVQETVFYDADNETLLVSDFLFYFDDQWNPWSRTFFRLAGCYGAPKVSRLFRSMIRNRDAFRRSLEPLLSLRLKSIIPAHGKIITETPEAILKQVHRSLAPGP